LFLPFLDVFSAEGSTLDNKELSQAELVDKVMLSASGVCLHNRILVSMRRQIYVAGPDLRIKGVSFIIVLHLTKSE
jgi:hypothetical protein